MSLFFDENSFVAAARAGDFRRVLEPQSQLIAAICANPALRDGEPREALGQLSEIAARLLDAERVGIWALDAELSKMTCLDLFVAKDRRHTSGAIVSRVEVPRYFGLVLEGGVIAADDAPTDPRLAELGRNYLAGFNIGALLVCPILIERRMAGAICAERVGAPRRWEGWQRLLGSSLAECGAAIISEVRSSASGRWRKLAG